MFNLMISLKECRMIIEVQNKNKYNAIMGALAGVIYREMRSKEPTLV